MVAIGGAAGDIATVEGAVAVAVFADRLIDVAHIGNSIPIDIEVTRILHAVLVAIGGAAGDITTVEGTVAVAVFPHRLVDVALIGNAIAVEIRVFQACDVESDRAGGTNCARDTDEVTATGGHRPFDATEEVRGSGIDVIIATEKHPTASFPNLQNGVIVRARGGFRGRSPAATRVVGKPHVGGGGSARGRGCIEGRRDSIDGDSTCFPDHHRTSTHIHGIDGN